MRPYKDTPLNIIPNMVIADTKISKKAQSGLTNPDYEKDLEKKFNEQFNLGKFAKIENSKDEPNLAELVRLKDTELEDRKEFDDLKELNLDNNSCIEADKLLLNLYKDITDFDVEETSIGKYNWSGLDIKSGHLFTKPEKTAKVLNTLNQNKISIWLNGFHGAYLLSRRYMEEFMDAGAMELFLMLCVIGNTLILGLEGLVTESTEDLFDQMNLAFTIIFGVEMMCKIYGFGFKKYLDDMFNTFDSFVVILSFVEIAVQEVTASSSTATKPPPQTCFTTTCVEEADAVDTGGSAISAFRAFRIFRIFRVLRVTRLLRGLRFMKIIVQVIGSVIMDFAYITFL